MSVIMIWQSFHNEYMYQIITLYTLIIYNFICQLSPHKYSCSTLYNLLEACKVRQCKTGEIGCSAITICQVNVFENLYILFYL